MKEKFDKFVSESIGKPVEVSDPSNLNQCMDLAFKWCDEIGVDRTAITHLYASQIWTNPNDLTIKYFEMIPNTPLGIPQIGDIVVFKGGVAGHVSVATGVGDTNSFQSFDQNWGTTVNKCGYITHVYDNVLGFLRFREPQVPVQAEFTDQTIISKELLNYPQDLEIQQIRGLLSDLVKEQGDNTNLKISITALNASITDLQAKYDQLVSQPQTPPPSGLQEPIFKNSLASFLYLIAKKLG